MRTPAKYRLRPDPMRKASLTAQLHDLKAREQALVAERREGQLHLRACLDEAERIGKERALDLAELAALNADTGVFRGSLPDPKAEQRRIALEESLGRPGKIAASLTASLERTSAALRETTDRRKRLETEVAEHEVAEKEFAEYELAQLRERAAANQVLSPVEKETLAQAG